jgi:hypothetical protein
MFPNGRSVRSLSASISQQCRACLITRQPVFSGYTSSGTVIKSLPVTSLTIDARATSLLAARAPGTLRSAHSIN